MVTEKMTATKNNKVFNSFTPNSIINQPKETVLHLETPYEDPPPQCRRQIHRVPPQLRRKNEKKSPYDPVIVSFGPYHHGKPDLRAAEEIKHRFLNRLTSDSPTKKSILHDMVSDKTDEIRACYDDDCIHDYDNDSLATMILLDACFIVALIEGLAGDAHIFLDWHQFLGIATLQFTVPDMMLLENQIPFDIIRLIVNLQRGEKEGEELMQMFLNWLMSSDFKSADRSFLQEHPLHLLEACHRMITADHSNQRTAVKQIKPSISGFKLTREAGFLNDRVVRSVTDLKAKGVKFVPSSSFSIGDIRFVSGVFMAELHLPVRMVWYNSLIVVSNMIAYEVSPGSESEFEVLSYVNLMKSLIEKPEDAKELEERGILINRFQNHEQLVEELRGVDTFGIDNFDIFKEVKMEMEEHCRSKAKTWMADLVHTRFSSPWSATALLAATFLVCLAFLQTFFTIHPSTTCQHLVAQRVRLGMQLNPTSQYQ